MGFSDADGSKRILYVCEYGTAMGGERSLLTWLPHVIAAGWDVHVMAPAEGPFVAELSKLPIQHTAWPAFTHQARSRLAFRREFLTNIIRQLQPHLVHANSLSMSRVVGPLTRELNVRSIGHVRDIVRISAQAMRDVNDNTRVLTDAHATADWHFAQGLNRQLTHVLYNGIDLTQFTPRPATGYLHDELKLPHDAQLLAAIGQVGMRKGLDILLAAMPEIVTTFPSVHLLVIGERTSIKDEAIAFEEQLHLAASQSPLSGHVHFLGYRTDIASLLNELTLLIHAARQEPLGRVLLEAAASGVPIVATDVGGTREILDADSGRIIPPDSPAQLSRSVIELLGDPVVMVKQAAVARTGIEARFSAHASAESLLQHYSALT